MAPIGIYAQKSSSPPDPNYFYSGETSTNMTLSTDLKSVEYTGDSETNGSTIARMAAACGAGHRKLYCEFSCTGHAIAPVSEESQQFGIHVWGIQDPDGARGLTTYQAWDGNAYYGAAEHAFGDTWQAGDVIGMAMSFPSEPVPLTGGSNAAKIWFSKNGVWQNSGDPENETNSVAAIVADCPMHPLWGCIYAGNKGTLRLAASDFSYSIPTGYSAWDQGFFEFIEDDVETWAYDGPTWDSNDHVGGGRTIRWVIPNSYLSGSGNQIRIKFPYSGSAGGWKFDECWIGHKGTGQYDFDGNQQQVTVNDGQTRWKNSGFHDYWSDPISISFDSSKDLVVSIRLYQYAVVPRIYNTSVSWPRLAYKFDSGGQYVDDTIFSGYSLYGSYHIRPLGIAIVG